MKRVEIAANPAHEDSKKRFLYNIAILLTDELEKEYEVVEKDFPDDLPDSWVDPDDKKERKITWISNFGLRNAAGKFEETLSKGLTYQVELPKRSGAFVYFDGRQVQRLKGQIEGEKFFAALNLGDPPLGESL